MNRRLFALWLTALSGGWLGAWVLFRFLETRWAWLQQPLGSTLGFWKSNLACALLFAGLHLPGWLFMQGVGVTLLAQTALLGFGFGLVRGREGALWAPIAVHLFNNAWSTGLINWLR